MAQQQVPKVSVAALGKVDKDGFLTKQGGAIKTWHRRWFVLKDNNLYYYKSPKDTEQKGQIQLVSTSACNPEPAMKKKGKFYFSVGTPNRKYFIFADDEESMSSWVDIISKTIDNISKGGTPPKLENANPSPPANTTSTETKPVTTTHESPKAPESGGSEIAPKPSAPITNNKPANDTPKGEMEKLQAAKAVVTFLGDPDNKVGEFWEIWIESVPIDDAKSSGSGMEFQISTSVSGQKLTWRTAGAQNLFIQRMVDFFWNVGAPETEIDRLNDIGALINPHKIGSWIDMSAKGGMDGGWFFPVDNTLKIAIEAADPGDSSRKLVDWAEKHNITRCCGVGRDMGAAPPRQTELRFALPGSTFTDHNAIIEDAFSSFGFPSMPQSVIHALHECANTSGLILSVITSSEGFVRLGVLVPNPPQSVTEQLCQIAGGSVNYIESLQNAIGIATPAFVEYQFLNEGFGYSVYKEGFDIVFHYNVFTL